MYQKNRQMRSNAVSKERFHNKAPQWQINGPNQIQRTHNACPECCNQQRQARQPQRGNAQSHAGANNCIPSPEQQSVLVTPWRHAQPANKVRIFRRNGRNAQQPRRIPSARITRRASANNRNNRSTTAPVIGITMFYHK